MIRRSSRHRRFPRRLQERILLYHEYMHTERADVSETMLLRELPAGIRSRFTELYVEAIT